MNNISSYLSKFKNLLSSDEDRKKAVSESVLKVSNIKIEPKNIKVKGSNVFIKTSPPAKAEIFMKKAEILQHLKLFEETKQIRDIR